MNGAARSGEFVAKHIQPVDGTELPDEAIQPNGVDLSIGTLYRLEGTAQLTNDDYKKQIRQEVTPTNRVYKNKDEKVESYAVHPSNAYVIQYGEQIQIPEDHIGLVFPRSRLMRCGLSIETAVWDAGYEGRGEGQLTVQSPAHIETNMRVAQMVYIRTEDLDESYDGSHQHEGL